MQSLDVRKMRLVRTLAKVIVGFDELGKTFSLARCRSATPAAVWSMLNCYRPSAVLLPGLLDDRELD